MAKIRDKLADKISSTVRNMGPLSGPFLGPRYLYNMSTNGRAFPLAELTGCQPASGNARPSTRPGNGNRSPVNSGR